MRVLYTEREDHAVTMAIANVRDGLDADEPILNALAEVVRFADGALHEELAESLRGMRQQIANGSAFSNACATSWGFSDAVVVATVNAGEVLHILDRAIVDLVDLRERGHEYGGWFYNLCERRDHGHSGGSFATMEKYRAEPETAPLEALALLRTIDRAWFLRHLAFLTALDERMRRAECEVMGLEAVLRTATDQLSLESHRAMYAHATRAVANGAALASALRSTGDAIPDAVLRTVELGAQVEHLPHLLAAAAAIAHDLAEAKYCGILQRAVASSDQRTKIVAAADDHA